jgi:hypothetical protein
VSDHTEGLDLRQQGSGVVIVAAGATASIVAFTLTVQRGLTE